MRSLPVKFGPFLCLAGLCLNVSGITFTNDTFIGADNTNFDGQEIVLTNCTLTLDGPHSFTALDILNGGVVTHLATTNGQGGDSLSLVISNDVEVESGGAIDVSGRGFGGSSGPGQGRTTSNSTGYYGMGAGGGYGGFGGASANGAPGGDCYGSASAPASEGSGGGSGVGAGGSGGGAIRITAGGLFRIEGAVLADGADGSHPGAGGGSGGSIWLSANAFYGAGTISARGGAGEPRDGGGGGGGRIALDFLTNAFSGTISASGGNGAVIGGAGTIYTLNTSGAVGQLLIDNGGRTGTNTLLSSDSSMAVVLSGGAVAGTPIIGEQTMAGLIIHSNAWLTTQATGFNGKLVAHVSGDASIEAGGGVTVTGRGYPANQGPGVGGAGTDPETGAEIAGGGGYGGFGGGPGGGKAYGRAGEGAGLPGSGGAGSILGGAGGGVVSLSVDGTLELDGRVAADGDSPSAPGRGAGSGGSVTIKASNITGTGWISANGGAGLASGGGGGGGRIAILSGSNVCSNTVTAWGGAGMGYGGAGTVLYDLGNHIRVVVDNGNRAGTNTLVGAQVPVDLDVRQGGRVVASNAVPFASVLVESNAWLVTIPSPASRTEHLNQMTVLGDATLQAGGGILLDGLGYGSSVGPGAGRYDFESFTGGGGGYGGYGGLPGPETPLFGGVYGSIVNPTNQGSGGAILPYEGFGSVAGAGGGALSMIVDGTLQVDGRISANGNSASASAIGGGAGGSLNLSVGRLAGNGSIAADGGSGDPSLGGGGGGGRIAISYGTNQFTGAISARGGGGLQYGGAGTIYLHAKDDSSGRLIVDNGGRRGNSTPITGLTNLIDLIVSNGGVADPVGVSTRDLTLSSNAWLSAASPGGATNLQLSVTGDMVVHAGAGIDLNGQGYAASQGPGRGQLRFSSPYGSSGGGGGHGGYGGADANGEAGGAVYDSVLEPSLPGSGGGSEGPVGLPNNASAGGGAARLIVAGSLVLDGRLSADGADGGQRGGGGGAGGSLWITAGTLSGTGSISANGGNGDPIAASGGGGGGRIAISYGTNQFAGTISARGGAGSQYGGAGTICLHAEDGSLPRVIVDNAGARGNSTPITGLTSLFDLVVSNGGVAAPVDVSMQSLTLNSNAWLSTASPGAGTNLRFSVLGDLVVHAGAGIDLDGQGYAAGHGPGAGAVTGYKVPIPGIPGATTDSLFGTGGGHGGLGGADANGQGGMSYDSILAPVFPGSGGGNPQPMRLPGVVSAGGGAARLMVGGRLVLDGRLSADGADGLQAGGGGGAGGSLWIAARTLSGDGTISANGGNGDSAFGGGGGGGRIAVYVPTNLFAGTFSARGGDGVMPGGAGTIYFQGEQGGSSELLVDNGGLAGTNTPLPALQNVEVALSGNAVAVSSAPTLVASGLHIASGASLESLPGFSLNVEVFGDLLIGANGSISADADGFSGSSGGPGAGSPSLFGSGGGGYGGMGGAGASGARGGQAYGSATEPADFGSRGGVVPLNLAGFCQGGGALRLGVTGTLQVDGRLSANGNDALIEAAGGGAGGSIWVTAHTLLGAGSISAKGGDGDPSEGGGGGGGRIALYSVTNSFSGIVSVSGGQGASPGQNGTIIITNEVVSSPSLVVANSSSSGGLTFQWFGANGVTYQLLCSTNLVDWQPCLSAMLGTNGPVALAVPTTNDPRRFFRLLLRQ